MVIKIVIVMIDGMAGLANAFGLSMFQAPGLFAWGVIESLLWLACMIVFIFFLRSVCLVMRKENIASTLVTYLISAGGVGLVAVLLNLLFFGLAIGARSIGILYLLWGLNILLAICGLGLFIWYIVIIFQVKGAVNSWIKKL